MPESQVAQYALASAVCPAGFWMIFESDPHQAYAVCVYAVCVLVLCVYCEYTCLPNGGE